MLGDDQLRATRGDKVTGEARAMGRGWEAQDGRGSGGVGDGGTRVVEGKACRRAGGEGREGVGRELGGGWECIGVAVVGRMRTEYGWSPWSIAWVSRRTDVDEMNTRRVTASK